MFYFPRLNFAFASCQKSVCLLVILRVDAVSDGRVDEGQVADALDPPPIYVPGTTCRFEVSSSESPVTANTYAKLNLIDVSFIFCFSSGI